MHSKKILLGVNILLTILVLWPISDMVMTWSPGQAGPGTLEGAGPKENGKAQKHLGKTRKITDYQALIQQDIFRTTRQRPRGPAVVEEDKPVELTKLNLKLKGIVIRTISKSFAVIMDGTTRKEDIYYVNDTLQNARIAKILPDQVILSVNNRQEALLLFAEVDRREPGRASVKAGKTEVSPPAKGVAAPHQRRPPGRVLPGKDRPGQAQGPEA